jgi:N-acetylglutamate synthase-like GNAT family acetyltransferase
MDKLAVQIRRPREDEWDRILEILETANFHHIGGQEMPEFPLGDCFVAVADGRVIGVAGYKILDATTAKTSLLAVDPEHRGAAVGIVLQTARQDFLRAQGIKELYTNSDDERVIDWYMRHFGYKPTGKRIPKLESFGRDDKTEWINMKVEL